VIEEQLKPMDRDQAINDFTAKSLIWGSVSTTNWIAGDRTVAVDNATEVSEHWSRHGASINLIIRVKDKCVVWEVVYSCDVREYRVSSDMTDMPVPDYMRVAGNVKDFVKRHKGEPKLPQC